MTARPKIRLTALQAQALQALRSTDRLRITNRAPGPDEVHASTAFSLDRIRLARVVDIDGTTYLTTTDGESA